MASFNLPTSVDAIFKGIKTKDAALFASGFDPTAVLTDEGHPKHGLEAIQTFAQKGLVDHNATAEIKDASPFTGSKLVLEVLMDGDYVEDYGITDPFTLFFDFTLTDNKIQNLTMTPHDPRIPTMQAAYAFHGDMNDPLRALRVGPRPIPSLSSLPAGWVRVKMTHAALNWHDLFTLKGVSLHELIFPRILGCEGVGSLENEDGSISSVLFYPVMNTPGYHGDETVDPKRNVLSEITQGTLAEYTILPRENCIPLPQGMDYETAACLGIAWLTAYRMLFSRSDTRPGQTILVQGSTGGVASALIQLASATGYHVWATGRSEEKRAFATKLGAERVFEPGADLPGFPDAIFDVSGPPTWDHTMKWIKSGGTVVTSGMHGRGNEQKSKTAAAGDGAEMKEGEEEHGKIKMDMFRLIAEQITVRGVWAGTRREFEDLVQLVTGKGIKPVVGKVLKLTEVKEGLKGLLVGETWGKTVIRI